MTLHSVLSQGLATVQEEQRGSMYRLKRTDAEVIVRHLSYDCMGYSEDGRRMTHIILALAAWLDETSNEVDES